MKLLKEIFEKDVFGKSISKRELKLTVRRSVRAIAFREDGKFPLVFLRENNYHIIPGGRIDPGETIKGALQREFCEEVGFDLKISSGIGFIITHEYYVETLHINYCFIGEIRGEENSRIYTSEEASQNPIVEWVTLNDALKTLRKDNPVNALGKFNRIRDLAFLGEAGKVANS
ncbi:MAG: NUDIX hydrolase [Candidatus Dojkabacteria bacterium]|nr:NUDIX hydrolase [Candidatus Dojkabacteria bacterium]